MKTRGHAVFQPERQVGVPQRARLQPGRTAGHLVLAGIVFLAMVPMFVSAMKATSTNSRRVMATGVAQARIEKIRMLAANMSDPGFDNGPHGLRRITTPT